MRTHLILDGGWLLSLTLSVRRIDNMFARTLGALGVFVMSLLLTVIVATWAWDAFVNGKLYYCTDGGDLDFLFVGQWVHNPESVAHVVPRSMSEPDEIKSGWSITALWCLWSTFVAGSVLVCAAFAATLWSATSPNRTIQQSGARGLARPRFGSRWRPAPTADGDS